jgi:hypothetical protein|tara:strand:- start:140 stop:601 length:462 start_codon:yes stop_codon:yes gene_type:complete
MKLFENIKNTMKKPTMLNLVLIVIFIIYLLIDFDLPSDINNLISSPFGNIIVILFVLALVCTKNPLVVILGILFGYELIRRTTLKTGVPPMSGYLPPLTKPRTIKFPSTEKTLEEEMVDDLLPLTSGPKKEPKYASVSTTVYNASSITDKTTL